MNWHDRMTERGNRVEKHYSDHARRLKEKARERIRAPEVERERAPRPIKPYKADPRAQRPRPMGPNDYGNGPVIDNDTGKPVKAPRNPFKGPAGAVRRFRPPRLPNPFPLLDIIEPLVYPNPDKFKPPILPSNYHWCKGPTDWPILTGGRTWAHNPYFRDSGSCTIVPPLAGQGASNGLEAADPWYGVRLGAPRCYWWNNYHNTVSIPYRGALTGSIERTGPSLGPAQPMPYRPLISLPYVDPNKQRFALPAPPRWVFYDPPKNTVRRQKAVQPPEDIPEEAETTTPVDQTWKFESPSFGMGPVSGEFGSVPGVVTPPGQSPNVPPPLPPVPPATRTPPARGVKENKAISKSARIGKMLFKALDTVSEWAEVVDAIYDALPDDVKKRWDRDDRIGDNFGQYGLSGADWKLQALWHNWHRLDTEQAIKNIIRNELQDQVIGSMQGKLPKNSGNATRKRKNVSPNGWTTFSRVSWGYERKEEMARYSSRSNYRRKPAGFTSRGRATGRGRAARSSGGRSRAPAGGVLRIVIEQQPTGAGRNERILAKMAPPSNKAKF